MPLSKREKITVGIVSASVSFVAIGVAMKMIHKRSRVNDAYNDYSDDEEEDYAQHLKYLQRTQSQPVSNGKAAHSSHSMNASRDLNVFKSPKLNEFSTSRLNSDILSQQDSIADLQDLSAMKLLPDNVRFMGYKQVIEILRTKKRDYVLFDLRKIDYCGGHIAGCINISDKTFYDQIPDILQKYHNVPMIMLQCMDGTLRSIENVEFLAKARNELILNYDEETQSSYYYQYKLKIEHDAHKTVMRSINWEKESWMKQFVETKKVVIDFTKDDNMYRNIRHQQYFVIAGGFFDFINSLINDTEFEIDSIPFHSVIADFNMAHWEELYVMGGKKLYHRTEYYTTRRINPLRKTQTKREF